MKGQARTGVVAALTDRSLPPPKPIVAIPLEIVNYVIKIVLARHRVGSPKVFRELSALSLACHSLRHLVLRAYLRDVVISTRRQWEGHSHLAFSIENRYLPCYLEGGLSWTRTLSLPSTCIARSNAPILMHLTRLRQLSLDFAQDGLSTQHTRLQLIVNNLTLRMPSATCDQLTALTLTSLPRIDVSMLRLVARHFPLLADLYLSCTERLEDTWWSFEDSASCTLHSPIPYVYADENHLATAFSIALKPLTNLISLHLGIYLSDEDFLSAHSDECHLSCGEENPYGCVSGISACPYCLPTAARTRQRELRASILFAQNLKALRCIGWSSLFRNSFAQSSPHTFNNANCTDRHPVRPTIDRLSSVFWLHRMEDGRVRACCHTQ
ncbi:hypothetical protein HDZ31DRAFT_43950 [Schizophyllum fasciatum]